MKRPTTQTQTDLMMIMMKTQPIMKERIYGNHHLWCKQIKR